MRVIRTGGKYSIIGTSVETYDILPVKTYVVGHSDDEGCFLIEHANIQVSEKTYGVHNLKVDKVLKSYRTFERSLGIILSGDKGIGKSIFAKMLCEKAICNGYPIIIVDESVPGIARFLESIDQECVVLFDEFDKTFRHDRYNNEDDDQAKLLSLFDGTAGGKKLYIVTCNELYGLNDYIINRPGRFHYHFRFEYPTNKDIREYLIDKLEEKYYAEIDKVIMFAQRVSLNYDCLRAIAFELNQGASFSDAVTDLNILNVNQERFDITLYLDSGEILHRSRCNIDLYDTDNPYMWITMYDDAGCEVLDVRCDKRKLTYEASLGATVIPKEGVKLDFSDVDNENIVDMYKNMKPLYITFKKCNSKKLHFVI